MESSKAKFTVLENNTRYYTCPRCGYKTIENNNFCKHLLRVKVCRPIVSNDDLSEAKTTFLENRSTYAIDQHMHCSIGSEDYAKLTADFLMLCTLVKTYKCHVLLKYMPIQSDAGGKIVSKILRSEQRVECCIEDLQPKPT